MDLLFTLLLPHERRRSNKGSREAKTTRPARNETETKPSRTEELEHKVDIKKGKNAYAVRDK